MWHVPSSAWRVLATCWMGVLAVLTECAIISLGPSSGHTQCHHPTTSLIRMRRQVSGACLDTHLVLCRICR
jgi:hypothetical protein